MTYCPKCGKKNEDDAKYCNDCGASLTGQKDREKGWDDRCEDECDEECAGDSRHGSRIWGLIVFCIGLWIVLELGLSNIEGMPDWLTEFDLWWIIPVVIGAIIISKGVKMIIGKN